MHTTEECKIYNHLTLAYGEASQRDDVSGIITALENVKTYLKTLPVNTKMYGDRFGYTVAGELLDSVERRLIYWANL